MKLKILHQSPESRVPEQRLMKGENLEIDEMEESQIRVSPEEENSPHQELPLVNAFHPMLVSGKRKRKPKELIDDFVPIIRVRKKNSSSSKSKDVTPPGHAAALMRKVDCTFGRSSNAQSNSPTMVRAEEVQSSLSNDQPNFLKFLVRSHVGSCFWMGLPVPFCKVYLPSEDTMVVLENENGEEFPVKYIANKTGLSAGWRKFVAGSKLLEGDVLIFQLIGPCKFKVYIIRANDLTEVDGALSLLILDSQTKQNDAEASMDAQIKKRRHRKSLPLKIVHKKKHNEASFGSHPEKQPEEHSGNDSDEVASEVLECTKFNESSFNFKDVKTFEDFHIVVNGVCIDSELPEQIRRKYYELCSSKNAYLHERLLPGLYTKLACGIIDQTINIADCIKSCTLTTPRKDFEVWEKSLRSFELLGLNVGFLRARLNHLLNLAFDSEDAFEIRRYWEVKNEKSLTEDEIKKLETKIDELKEACEKYDREIEDLKVKAESYEVKFLEEVNAPW
ncbi:hypothetical protein ACP275_08G048700 [Erythranthe tilingii]